MLRANVKRKGAPGPRVKSSIHGFPLFICISIYKQKQLLLYVTSDWALALEYEASFWLENIEEMHVKRENDEELIWGLVLKCVSFIKLYIS